MSGGPGTGPGGNTNKGPREPKQPTDIQSRIGASYDTFLKKELDKKPNVDYIFDPGDSKIYRIPEKGRAEALRFQIPKKWIGNENELAAYINELYQQNIHFLRPSAKLSFGRLGTYEIPDKDEFLTLQDVLKRDWTDDNGGVQLFFPLSDAEKDAAINEKDAAILYVFEEEILKKEIGPKEQDRIDEENQRLEDLKDILEISLKRIRPVIDYTRVGDELEQKIGGTSGITTRIPIPDDLRGQWSSFQSRIEAVTSKLSFLYEEGSTPRIIIVTNGVESLSNLEIPITEDNAKHLFDVMYRKNDAIITKRDPAPLKADAVKESRRVIGEWVNKLIAEFMRKQVEASAEITRESQVDLLPAFIIYRNTTNPPGSKNISIDQEFAPRGQGARVEVKKISLPACVQRDKTLFDSYLLELEAETKDALILFEKSAATHALKFIGHGFEVSMPIQDSSFLDLYKKTKGGTITTHPLIDPYFRTESTLLQKFVDEITKKVAEVFDSRHAEKPKTEKQIRAESVAGQLEALLNVRHITASERTAEAMRQAPGINIFARGLQWLRGHGPLMTTVNLGLLGAGIALGTAGAMAVAAGATTVAGLWTGASAAAFLSRSFIAKPMIWFSTYNLMARAREKKQQGKELKVLKKEEVQILDIDDVHGKMAAIKLNRLMNGMTSADFTAWVRSKGSTVENHQLRETYKELQEREKELMAEDVEKRHAQIALTIEPEGVKSTKRADELSKVIDYYRAQLETKESAYLRRELGGVVLRFIAASGSAAVLTSPEFGATMRWIFHATHLGDAIRTTAHFLGIPDMVSGYGIHAPKPGDPNYKPAPPPWELFGGKPSGASGTLSSGQPPTGPRVGAELAVQGQGDGRVWSAVQNKFIPQEAIPQHVQNLGNSSPMAEVATAEDNGANTGGEGAAAEGDAPESKASSTVLSKAGFFEVGNNPDHLKIVLGEKNSVKYLDQALRRVVMDAMQFGQNETLTSEKIGKIENSVANLRELLQGHNLDRLHLSAGDIKGIVSYDQSSSTLTLQHYGKLKEFIAQDGGLFDHARATETTMRYGDSSRGVYPDILGAKLGVDPSEIRIEPAHAPEHHQAPVSNPRISTEQGGTGVIVQGKDAHPLSDRYQGAPPAQPPVPPGGGGELQGSGEQTPFLQVVNNLPTKLDTSNLENTLTDVDHALSSSKNAQWIRSAITQWARSVDLQGLNVAPLKFNIFMGNLMNTSLSTEREAMILQLLSELPEKK